MDVRSKPEIGMKNPEMFRDLKACKLENPAALPTTPDSERQMVTDEKIAKSVLVSQSKDVFKVTGTQIDKIA